MRNFLWKIGGEAGFGIMTVGMSFSKIAARSGYHVFDYNEYPSLIRGGHNTYEVHVGDKKIHSQKQEIDVLVCLNKETYLRHKDRLTSRSVVIYDPDEFDFPENFKKAPVPFRSLKAKNEAMQIMVNTIAMGASLAVLGADMTIFYDIIEEEFSRKGQSVVDFNKKFADLGYNYVQEHHKDLIRPLLNRRADKEKLVMTGNDAFSFAAVGADCRFYAAYPMTPSSTVMTSLAAWQYKTGMVVRHAEDEIAVVLSALGASHAGVRASVGTSGGGFALMTEAVSYAGVAEIPIVVFVSQRPGPATGMPTWTEQAELLFAVHSGHGEFPKIVLAPGDVEEMLELTVKAFDLADIYQTPVIVLSDKYLSESHISLYKDHVVSLFANHQPDRGKTITEFDGAKYLRYELTDDGISPRLLPGPKGQFYQANSYSHTEDSHTTEDAEPRLKQVDKLNRKTATYLATHYKAPQVYGSLEHADSVFVSWGGNKGPILDAQRILEEKGIRTAYIHITHMYPVDPERIKPLFAHDKRYILVENNSQAQLGQLLRMQTGIDLTEKLLKYDGRPIYTEEIVDYIENRPQVQKI